MKFVHPEVCPVCGKEYEGYDGAIILDGQLMCPKCFRNHDFKGKPFFVQHIPPYVDGCNAMAFTFDNEKQLRERLTDYVPEDSVLMQTDESTIMYRSTTENFWWVIGTVHNFDLTNSSIPVWNRKLINIIERPEPI